MYAGSLRTRWAEALGQHGSTCPRRLLCRTPFLQWQGSPALMKYISVQPLPHIEQPINRPSASRKPIQATLTSSVDIVLDSLNQEQEAAAKSTNPAVRVIAGPGSGKTRVITARIAWLINKQKVKPWNIMAITFTNKAAAELKERLTNIIGGSAANRVVVGTFHAICSKMFLRPYVHLLDLDGLTHSYTCLDEDDSLAELCNVLDDMQEFNAMDQKTFSMNAKQVWSAIEDMKNSMETTHSTFVGDKMHRCISWSSHEQDKIPRPMSEERLQAVFEAYHRVMYRNNCMDFGDVLSLAVYILKNNPNLLAAAQARFEHVLVDEFQDTNTPQYALVKLLKGSDNNLFVVGDPDQAIYNWRGADTNIMIEEFAKDYPSGQLCYLLNNYRSTPDVLTVSEAVLSHDGLPPLHRSLVPKSGKTGGLIQHISVNSAVQVKQQPSYESLRIIEAVRKLHRVHGCKLSDIAVLYRFQAMSKPMADALRQAGIPVRVWGEISFFKKADIKDLIAYLTWTINPSDSISISRVLSKPSRGLGSSSKQHLVDLGNEYAKSWAAMIFEDLENVGVLFMMNHIHGRNINLQATTWLTEQEAKDVVRQLKNKKEDEAKKYVTMPSVSGLVKKLMPNVKFTKKQIEGLDDLRALLVVLRSVARYTTMKDTVDVLLKLARFCSFQISELDIEIFRGMAARFDENYIQQQQQQQTNTGNHSAGNVAASPSNTADKISNSINLLQQNPGNAGAGNASAITSLQKQLEALQLADPQDQQLLLPMHLERLCEFLEKLNLNRETQEHGHNGDALFDAVNLMSIHSAKGLEFRAVCILAWEDGILPSRSDIEEENRLAYVGCTRAKEFLIFTYARERLLYGKIIKQQWSRFMTTVRDSDARHLIDWD